MRRLTLLLLLMTTAPLIGQEPPSDLSKALQEFRALLAPLGTKAARWRCNQGKKVECSSAGCQPNTGVATWLILDVAESTYSRCDVNGCDEYAADFESAGMFTTVTPISPTGTFLKVTNDGSEFIDTASIGVGAMLTFGKCVPDAGR